MEEKKFINYDELEKEHREVKDRYMKLVEFMQTGEFFNLSENHKTVLQNQKLAMEMYLQQLNLQLYSDLDDDTKYVPNAGMLGMIANMFNNPWSSPSASGLTEERPKKE